MPKPDSSRCPFSTVGSPMTCPIVDGTQYAAFGDGLQQAVLNKTASFIVDPKGSETGDCNVVITGKLCGS